MLALLDLRGNSPERSLHWSPDHKSGSVAAIAFAGCIDTKQSSASSPAFYLGELSDSVSLLSCSRHSDPLSEDVVLPQSSLNGVTLRSRRRFFTWRGILSTKQYSGLTILSTWPLPSFVLHWICGALISDLVMSEPKVHINRSHWSVWVAILRGHIVPVDNLLDGTAHPDRNPYLCFVTSHG